MKVKITGMAFKLGYSIVYLCVHMFKELHMCV